MPYNLYYMNGDTGRVARIETITAEDDRAAIEAAASRDWDGILELWQVNRFVAEFGSSGPPAAA